MAKTNGSTATPPQTNPAEGSAIQIKRLERIEIVVPVVGTAPLIVNQWSQKAKEQMLAAQQSSARAKKEPKDPVANFEASKYLLPDGRDGFPASGFKAAIVTAARLFEGVTMVSLKQGLTTVGIGPDQLVPITYSSVRMREDTPRNANGVADLRYRAEYSDWSADIVVRFIKGQFDAESIYALVDAAGNGGIGEWRPTSPKSNTGTYGTFRIDDDKL